MTIQRDRYRPSAQAIYDLASDMNPHSRDELLTAAVAAELGTDYWGAINVCRRTRSSAKPDHGYLADQALIGARNLARNQLYIATRECENRHPHLISVPDTDTFVMETSFADEWAAALAAEQEPRPREPISTQEFGAITYYGGMSEWEGWAYAPLRARDVAHVQLVHTAPIDELRAAFPGWEVSEDPYGLVSVAAHPGAPVKAIVTEYLNRHSIAHDGVRDATNVARRDLTQLPSAFLHDAVVKTLPIAFGVVAKRHGASMEVLVGSPEDAQAWVRLWVVELATTFNARLGRPFGTWVTNKIPREVQDLNRKINGRTASDLAIRVSKAEDALIADSGRVPTQDEMASHMGLSAAQMHHKRAVLSQLRAIRTANTLDTGPDAPEIPVVDVRANPERDALLREQSSRITMALITASGTYNPSSGHNELDLPLGFLCTYLLEWADWVKSDLTHLAAAPSSKVGKQLDEVKARLRRDLADLAKD